MKDDTFIASYGNIGAGKTTGTNVLADEFGLEPITEKWEDNPYLEGFYRFLERFYDRMSTKIIGQQQEYLPPTPEELAAMNSKGLAFLAQRWFLLRRTQDHDQINVATKPVIQDRTIYEDRLFAQNQFELGMWTPDEWGRYEALASLVLPELRTPNLLIYFWASEETLRKRILVRIKEEAREMEKPLLNPNNPYLSNLQRLYDQFFQGYRRGPVIKINTDILNILESDDDKATFINAVERKLRGEIGKLETIAGVENY